MHRPLLAIGIACIIAAFLWPWLRRFPLFRLPGDIVYRNGGFTFFFPITSMVIISLAITLVMWLFRR